MRLGKMVSTNWERLTTRSLPEYVLHYFDVMKAQFDTLPIPDSTEVDLSRHYADAKRVVDLGRDNLFWSNLMLLDLSIMHLLSFECLQFKVAELRHRLDGCSMPFALDLPKLESATIDNIAILRCEAEALISQLWQSRIARNSRNFNVGELRRTVLYGMLLITTFLIGIGYVLDNTPLYIIIMASGMSGALVSILRRLQSAAESVTFNLDRSSDLSALAYEKRAILISLLAGGAFAIVLYLLFMAGLSQLSGELAPKFSSSLGDLSETDAVVFRDFVNNIGPATEKDYAKVVVWSFAAGFFEQLVPDVLDRLIKRDQGTKRS